MACVGAGEVEQPSVHQRDSFKQFRASLSWPDAGRGILGCPTPRPLAVPEVPSSHQTLACGSTRTAASCISWQPGGKMTAAVPDLCLPQVNLDAGNVVPCLLQMFADGSHAIWQAHDTHVNFREEVF